jgi:hypothetical protein
MLFVVCYHGTSNGSGDIRVEPWFIIVVELRTVEESVREAIVV